MPHYNLGQLYTREFRYAQASEELARAASFDFDMVRNLQAEAQLHPGDPLPPAWGWLEPRTFWDALVREPADPERVGVPASWRGWLEVRGQAMLWITALCTLLGFAVGVLIRVKLPVRQCSNCDGAVCRRCAARRRDQVFCAGCSASLREASTPEFARLLLARRRRTVRRGSARWRTAFATLLPGLGPMFVNRLGFAWTLLIAGMIGITSFVGVPGPFPYDPRVGPLAALHLPWRCSPRRSRCRCSRTSSCAGPTSCARSNPSPSSAPWPVCHGRRRGSPWPFRVRSASSLSGKSFN
jgi:hypothetical protein